MPTPGADPRGAARDGRKQGPASSHTATPAPATGDWVTGDWASALRKPKPRASWPHLAVPVASAADGHMRTPREPTCTPAGCCGLPALTLSLAARALLGHAPDTTTTPRTHTHRRLGLLKHCPRHPSPGASGPSSTRSTRSVPLALPRRGDDAIFVCCRMQRCCPRGTHVRCGAVCPPVQRSLLLSRPEPSTVA
jgi:hypothetical protein